MNHLDRVIHDLVQREGGFVNKKSDKGGPTKYGITQKTLATWRKKKVTIQDVIDLPLAEAEQIYKELYVRQPGYMAFDDEALAEQLIDAGVHHGCTRAVKLIQKAVGSKPDGVIGPDTITRAAKLKPVDLFIAFMGQRIDYFALCLKDQTQWEYAEGWMNRCIAMCKLYIAGTQLTPPQKAFIVDAMGVMTQSSKILKAKSAWPKSVALFEVCAKLFKEGRTLG